MIQLPIGDVFDKIISFLSEELREVFDAIREGIDAVISGLEWILSAPPFWVVMIIVAVAAWFLAGHGMAIFSAVGILLIASMDLWPETVDTLALVLTSTLISLLIGIPLGILSAKFEMIN